MGFGPAINFANGPDAPAMHDPRPFVLYPEDAADGMYDGRFEADVVVCVESYVGALGGSEGVKLEEPVLITESGPVVLSALPLDAADF